ncbi:hypothetical protein [Actinoplanes lobatus]|uniref:Uncharacterized protein n=1 Tax=Actinoplanes lobatus TaxID=113568 RepID=A0A7W7HRW2_9ACTN|nr:hypothetical protein [Actinoplanes lobatus]MBB4755332.1 hypothetical protein [Actinoplanes lobatus]GIE46390.1 hypothetical protein Alo02nite_92880 [Actinoplanes lobatus]
MAEPIDIPAAVRAQLDHDLATAIGGLLSQAAERDGLDVIEANVDLTLWLLARMTPDQLAASAAALAIRLHRTTTEVAL